MAATGRSGGQQRGGQCRCRGGRAADRPRAGPGGGLWRFRLRHRWTAHRPGRPRPRWPWSGSAACPSLAPEPAG